MSRGRKQELRYKPAYFSTLARGYRTGAATMKTILDERIREELQGLSKRLGEEGKLPTTAQLSNYCETFRSRFGPDKLKNLDGEALLETMHGPGNKDSLVYWLEFKDDEEFPSPRFGSIAGGSAFKFGLFRKSETGRWTTGSSKGPIELTVEQAIDKARKHRDQLLRGIELLEQMPVDGTDEDYARLQLEMNHVAPDVSDLAWAHKYFHLLFTEKLDDFHNPNYQRFHLIRLLQLPPQGEGRYFAAGRFVALAQTLDIPMNTLTAILNGRDGATPYNYWRIGTSEKERGEREYWPRMLEGNYCAIRWPEVGDLSAISNDKTGQERIRQIMQARYPHETAQSIGKMVHQIFSFRWKLNQGDVVLATAGESVIGIGKVRGEYKFEQTDNFPHRRDVEWLSFDEWKLPDPEASTVAYRMKKDINLVESERHMLNAVERPPYAPAREAAVHVASVYVTPPLPRLPDIAVHIQAILERKGQVILYGPPGTGKTYWAEYTARELAARSRFSIPFDQLHAEQQTFLFGDSDYVQGNVRMCSFHPTYGYEDFLEGFRPEPVNGQMHFVLREGIFAKMLKPIPISNST
jgi:5-methylcytosine-specific restriction enzyme B